jgi:DNA recombination protein RmuC
MEYYLLIFGCLLLGMLGGWYVSRTKSEAIRAQEKANFSEQVSIFQEKLNQRDTEFDRATAELSSLTESHSLLGKELLDTKVSLAQYQEKAERVPNLEAENQRLSQLNTELKEQIAAEVTRREVSEEATNEKLTLISQTEEKIENTFKALSQKVLKESTDSLMTVAKNTFDSFHKVSATDLDARKTAIDKMVAPISQALKEIESNRHASSVSLTEQIKSISEMNSSLRSEVGKLVQALKTPLTRGKWGEIQLRRAVEFAGMVKHCDFEEQESVLADGGKNLRPDMTVKLPNGRTIVVDAKVPLSAFLASLESESDSDRIEILREHANQVRNHIDSLSKKEYWAQFDRTPDFVFLFLPAESIYSAALQFDSELIEYAGTRRVILASPTNLIVLLQVVAHGWREAQIAENSNRIAVLGRELYERISTFSEHYSSLGSAIESTVKHYNKSVGSLERMVLPSARKIKDLGITTSATIEVLEPIESNPSQLTAPELVPPEIE